MVLSPQGATIGEPMQNTGLDAHSIRAIVSIARRDGTTINFDKRDGRYSTAQPA